MDTRPVDTDTRILHPLQCPEEFVFTVAYLLRSWIVLDLFPPRHIDQHASNRVTYRIRLDERIRAQPHIRLGRLWSTDDLVGVRPSLSLRYVTLPIHFHQQRFLVVIRIFESSLGQLLQCVCKFLSAGGDMRNDLRVQHPAPDMHSTMLCHRNVEPWIVTNLCDIRIVIDICYRLQLPFVPLHFSSLRVDIRTKIVGVPILVTERPNECACRLHPTHLDIECLLGSEIQLQTTPSTVWHHTCSL